MSRIRSQLDKMLENDRSESIQENSQEELRQRLDSRLRDLQEHARKASGDQPQSSAAPELDRIRQKLDVLAEKIGRSNHGVGENDGANHQEGSGQTSQTATSLAPQSADPGEMAEQLRAIRRAMDEMAKRSAAQPDLAALTHSIEAGYADIARRLENRTQGGESGKASSGQLDAVSKQLESLAAAVSELPGRPALDSLETRLQKVSETVAGLSETGAGPDAPQFAAMEERLDELTRAVVSLSVSPDEDNDALDRVEARLASLAKTVDQLVDNERQRAAEDKFPASLGELAQLPEILRDSLAEIEARLEGQDTRERDRTPVVEKLTGQIADFSGKLDNLLDAHADGGNGAIETRLAELGERIESLVQTYSEGQNETASQMFARIEAHLSTIVEGIDSVVTAGPALARMPDQQAEILKMLHGLVVLVDEIGDSFKTGEENKAGFAAMEARLAEISSRIDNMSAGDADLSPLSQRLEAIEQQLALTRDAAVDAVTQAAQQALQATHGAADENPAILQELTAELKKLETEIREGSLRHVQGFEALQETLIVIASRLGHSDDAYQPAQPADDSSDAAAATAHAPEVEVPRRAEPRDAFHDGAAQAAQVTAEYQEHAEASGPGPGHEEPSPQTEELPVAAEMREPETQLSETAERHAPQEATEEEIEDVPLEPGSGVPDLAALVRHASERRNSAKSGEQAGHENAGDYLTAARRAAQAAAVEAQAMAAEEERAQKEARKKKKLPVFVGVIKAKKRTIMLTAAAVGIVAVAAPLGYYYLNRGAAVTSGQTAMEAPIGDNEVPMAATELVAKSPAAGTEPADKAEPMESAKEANGAVEEQAPISPTPGQEFPVSRDDPGTGQDATEPDALPTADQGIATSPMPAPMRSAGTPPQASQVVEAQSVDHFVEPPTREVTVAPMPPEDVGNAALRQSAASGDAKALFEVGQRYAEGFGVDRDLAEAAKWYELAANQDFAPAQYRFASFLEKGHGTEINLERSVQWYEKAARNGNALAMHNLAVLRTSGLVDGKPQMREAVEWFTKAAELGIKDSQVNLGIIYAKALGVEEDLAESYKWFAIAARGGDTDAVQKRDAIAAALPPDQLEMARGKAEIWKARPLDPSANSAEIPSEWKDAASQSALMSRRELIAKAQLLLAEKGFDPGPADGMMGERTRQAVMEFQERAGLPANGEITEELVRKLVDESA